ncbi:MAG TPA: hypothetical protein VG346_03140 [Acidimicrobiales bacterium]|nr:hypothetical protein [Acidimicrobiales bacterium]
MADDDIPDEVPQDDYVEQNTPSSPDPMFRPLAEHEHEPVDEADALDQELPR